MPLDSLGLGLTLDTTLLEKADKTLENMHKNSKLVMQNLTRGITAFNEGKISDFSRVFDEMAKSMDKLSKTTVSPDFDTKGLEKGIGYVTELTAEIEKMQRAGTKEFFNPENLYTTTKSLTEATLLLKYFREEAKKVGDAIKTFLFNPIQISEAENNIKALKASLKGLSTDDDAYAETTIALKEEEDRLKDLEKELEAAKKAYGDLDSARLKSKEIIEQTAKAEQLVSWSSKTKAEQLAAITSYNNKIIADERARTKEVETLYKNNFTEMQRISKSIAQLEADREKIAKGGGDTTEQDINLAFYRDQLQKRIELEEEIAKSGYQKIAKIKEELDAKSFLNTSKQQVKNLQTEVAFANQFSKNAKNVEEEKQAIELLRSARNNLSKDTAHYSQIVEALNKRILSHKDHIETITREEKEQNTLSDSVINRYRKQLKALDDIDEALDKLAKKRKKTGVASGEDIANEKALKARRATIEKDILEIEKQAQGQLDVIREQHDAERAKKSVEETIRQNEREKQEYAKLLDDLHAIKKQKQSLEEYGGKNTKEYANLEAQEQKYQQRITAIRRNHMYDRAEIEEEHNKKVNDEAVREFIAAEKEKQRIAEEYAKKQREKARKHGTISSASANRLIGVTENANNINQHKAAIEKLTQAKASLDNTDKNYFVTLKKIDKALKKHHEALRDAGVESDNLMQSHRGLLNIGGQLARRLALAFSVSQLTQYFRKLVEVRGQFEKTEVALTSIIGDNQKAEKLMNQTIALAIKSPFTLQQLTGYTKQLAAYQVSYEELHSTTKMLADVSAGLGVEMDRLILAFGQVKAANYLRATEIRQFTEAGFNILGELADYYNELEGTMLSVGDVQEMVTKRMVDFADVEAVFHRVTEAGGMFYEMQSKQAETLAGQWTNLQDRIDVMLNEIGSDNEGLLKGLVRLLAASIDNWEAFADVLKVVVVAFALYKVNLLAVTKAQIANSLATQESIKLKIKEAIAAKSLSPIYKSLTSSMTGFGSAMKVFGKANLWVAALTAVISSIVALARHINKVNEALAEQDEIFNENTSSLQKLSEKYKEASKYSGDFNKKMEALRELSSKLEDRNLKLSVEIDEVKEDNIDKIFAENEQRLQKAYDFGKDLGKAIARGMNEAQGTIFGFSFFGENLKEDAEDYGQSMGKLMSWGMQAQMESIEDAARVNYKNMSKYAQEYFDSIKDGQRKNESDYEWAKRRATALVMISKLEGDIVGKNKELQRALRSVVGDSIELHHETKGVYNNIVEAVGGVDNLRRKLSDKPMDIAAQIKTEVDKLEYDPATKQFIMNDLYAMLHLKVNYVEDPNATADKVYKGFKKDLMDARSKLSKITDKDGQSLNYQNFFISTDEIDNMKAFSDGLEGIQKLYDKNKKTIEQLDGTSSSYNKEELDRLNALQNALKEVAKKWGYDLDLNAKGGESEALKKLKDQIKLIKDANKAYEERNKKFGKVDSQAVVTDSYKDAFKEVELAIEDIDYTNLEGVVDALESLEAEAKKAGGQVDLLKAISEVKAEIGLTLKERQDRELFNQVQEIFDDYELAVDIKKLNIPPELAKNLFGVDTKSFDQMRSEIISMFAGTNEEVSKILSKGYEVSAEDEKILIKAIGKDRVDKAKEALEKIQDLEDKDQLERLKMYVEYAKKGISERAKIKLEELRKLQEIEKTFKPEELKEEHNIEKAKEEGATDEQIKILEEENKKIREGNKAVKERNALLAEQGRLASEAVRKESQEQTNKLEWEEFEKSDMFIRVFDDLDNASTSLLSHLIEKIQGFKDEWTDMPLEDVEKIIEALNKLQTKLAEANPWKEFKDAKKDFEEAKKAVKFEDKEAKELSEKRGAGNYMAALDKEDIAQQMVLDDANKQIAALEVQLATQEKIVAVTEEEKTAKAQAIATTTKELNAQKGIKTNAENNLKATQKVRKEHTRVKTSLAAQYSAISESLDMAIELGGAISDLVGTLTDDDPAAIFGDMALQMLSTVANTLALQAQLIAARAEATGLGAAMNTAAGVIGWIVMAIQLLVTAISAVVNYGEKMRQMKLDVLAGQVDNLKQKFDALAESIDEAWSIKQLKEYEKELDKLQDKMKDTQEDYIKLLESNDKDKKTIETAKQAQSLLDNGYRVEDLTNKQRKALLSEEYQNYKDATDALAEIEEDYADKKQEILESVGGITDPHDAASEFVDAWLDAYKETGDGLAGLEENFDEFFENLIKQKAARMLSDTLLTKWIDTVNGALAEDSAGGRNLTESEMSDIKAAQEKAKGDINALLKGLFEGLDIGKEGGELSSLQKGIQGITADQAEILTAYWNSVRGYTASIDSKMDLILANMGAGTENNPMIEQLRAQTDYLKYIKEQLSYVLSPSGSTALKVRLLEE